MKIQLQQFSKKFFLWGDQFESVKMVTFNRRRVITFNR